MPNLNNFSQTKIDLNNFAIRLGKIFSNISILFLILSWYSFRLYS